MFELFQAAISPHQVLLSLLLVLVVLYWLLVILGALDFETDMPDADFDADTDAHHAHHGMSTGGVWLTAGRILGFSQVPMVVWISFLAVFLWFFSLVLNECFNKLGDVRMALLLFVPNFLFSLLVTKLVTLPIASLLRSMADASNEGEVVIGREGVVCSIEVDEKYGQLEILTDGAPVLLNVRVKSGFQPLKKGVRAVVTEAGPEHIYYFVESI